MYTLTDAFDDFMRYWHDASGGTAEQKLRLWGTSYMQEYPELLQKQARDYEEGGYDWREIARGKVFPRLGDYLPLMQEAGRNLLYICGPIYGQAVQTLGLDFPITFVIYVGIGCGAGWATQYQGAPACLLALEKIAELGWHSRERLQELVAHEIGHLAHMEWRNGAEEFERQEKDPLFLLYSEGFAKRCEYLILREEVWSQAEDENWLLWCGEHKRWLAKEYLYRADKCEAVNDFFGDWLNVWGHRQTGYYLGWAFILWLEQGCGVREIATLSPKDVRAEAGKYLRRLAGGLA
jgi:hypothetical protein